MVTEFVGARVLLYSTEATRQMTLICNTIRSQFAIHGYSVYADTAARGLMPKCARDAVTQYNADRAAGTVDTDELYATVERVRERFAGLIHATPDEVTLTQSASEGFVAIGCALPWQRGDNIVFCLDLEHPNNVYPWFNLHERLGI
ncbi:MAG: aminotransferase class V-fold PLP-dependent enzyme, partial [Gammaproteobacteria bacterium]|nr:aminotransferase class V-fold PLP-dependent enzyme [Gammaproteobacteria bacterium]